MLPCLFQNKNGNSNNSVFLNLEWHFLVTCQLRVRSICPATYEASPESSACKKPHPHRERKCYRGIVNGNRIQHRVAFHSYLVHFTKIQSLKVLQCQKWWQSKSASRAIKVWKTFDTSFIIYHKPTSADSIYPHTCSWYQLPCDQALECPQSEQWLWNQPFQLFSQVVPQHSYPCTPE